MFGFNKKSRKKKVLKRLKKWVEKNPAGFNAIEAFSKDVEEADYNARDVLLYFVKTLPEKFPMELFPRIRGSYEEFIDIMNDLFDIDEDTIRTPLDLRYRVALSMLISGNIHSGKDMFYNIEFCRYYENIYESMKDELK